MPESLTPRDLASLTGFSVSFIRSEIKAGELKATLAQTAAQQRGRWRIAQADADEYLARLGFSGPAAPIQSVIECGPGRPTAD